MRLGFTTEGARQDGAERAAEVVSTLRHVHLPKMAQMGCWVFRAPLPQSSHNHTTSQRRKPASVQAAKPAKANPPSAVLLDFQIRQLRPSVGETSQPLSQKMHGPVGTPSLFLFFSLIAEAATYTMHGVTIGVPTALAGHVATITLSLPPATPAGNLWPSRCHAFITDEAGHPLGNATLDTFITGNATNDGLALDSLAVPFAAPAGAGHERLHIALFNDDGDRLAALEISQRNEAAPGRPRRSSPSGRPLLPSRI